MCPFVRQEIPVYASEAEIAQDLGGLRSPTRGARTLQEPEFYVPMYRGCISILAASWTTLWSSKLVDFV